ncbi:hypothetical protein GCM10010387_16460 [Streptomyces inusitatus]|uniref:Uncharacterized protein n=1 Tax=Streptomyces inusitatus TaxID=68221 RepID=A0A918UP24_9ACTN|nr:hypothetical protein [Streptomyces inusitatus]GGZ23909.1 hypothetical protein GCM10010387_16460 [Streptomyces inusitatus]
MSAKLTRRAYCRCAVVENFDYDQAADRLGCKRSWLEANIADLPHQKRGQAVAFCDCELALIQAMTTVIPVAVLALLGADQASQDEAMPEPEAVPAIARISPSQGRGRTRTAF